ncbi:MAG TPA: hypothetical protein DHU55_00840, partial [Blastocatellia bacterium]|nr:hypothetical protein [Blastocatellia bacterium]
GFVTTRVEPFLRECQSSPETTRELKIADSGIDVEIRYAPGGDSLTATHPSYTSSYSLTRNPLFNTLKRKLDQLKRTGGKGAHGIIACAGDYDLRASSGGTFDSSRIIAEAFRQNSRLSFVLTLWSEDSFGACPIRSRLYRNARASDILPDDVAVALETLATHFPTAVNSGINALNELDFWRWKRGRYFYGSFSMNKHEIRVSARFLIELLAGRTTLEEFLARHGGDQGFLPIFEQKLRAGQILDGARIERDPEKDDDWVVFHFREWDPAMGSLRAEEE